MQRHRANRAPAASRGHGPRDADVLVIGSINLDLVVSLQRRPRVGETVIGERLEYRPGGKGANQAAAAARAGARTRLIGAIGADDAGADLLRGLRAQGVGTNGVVVLGSSRTGVASITVTPDGENTIVVVPGANAELHPRDLPSKGGVRRGGAVLCQLEIPEAVVAEAAAFAARAGARFVLNASPVRPLTSALLRSCDPLICNRQEAGQLLGTEGAVGPETLAEALLAAGARSAVVTLGGQGSLWAGSTGVIRVAAPTVDVVDTTGAGDAFAGALAAALSESDAGDAGPALHTAVEAGAAATRWRGAQPWTLPGTTEP